MSMSAQSIKLRTGCFAYRRKLVIAPAPEPAIASCPRERSSERGFANIRLIRLWHSPYVRNNDAFSAMAPTIGAGNPYSTQSSAKILCGIKH